MRHGGAQCGGRRCDVLSALTLTLAFTREWQQARKRNKNPSGFLNRQYENGKAEALFAPKTTA
jgi:hypothetical protein